MTVRTKAHGSATAEAPRSSKAKAIAALVAGTETTVQWFDLHGFADRNIRQDSFGDPIGDLYEQVRPLGDTKDGEGTKRAETDEDRKRIGDSLVGELLGGWKQQREHAINVTAATEEEQQKAVVERREILAGWRGRGAADSTFLALVAFVEQYWFPKGEAALPRAIVHMGHRRTYAMPAVVFARAQRGIGTIGDYSIPIAVQQPMATLAEIDQRLEDNLGSEQGRAEMTPLDYLRIARMISDAGGAESMLRKYGKVGEAQTAFRYISLNNRFPDLNLYNRAMLPRPAVKEKGSKQYPYVRGESYIPYSTSMKEALQALLSERDFKMSGSMGNRAKVPTTTDVVEEFAEYYTLGGRVRGGWTQQQTKQLREATKFSLLFNVVGYAIDNNAIDLLKAIDARVGKQVAKLLAAEGIDMDTIAKGEVK